MDGGKADYPRCFATQNSSHKTEQEARFYAMFPPGSPFSIRFPTRTRTYGKAIGNQFYAKRKTEVKKGTGRSLFKHCNTKFLKKQSFWERFFNVF
ncbi:hypothetical protein H0R92_13735 [Treponema sp. OMZ 840]|uniref:hypothetical protein n=1 Tax=Treponema sp. OMZ 840 TaxID=244313 RepID=UPI003D9406C3